MTQTTDSILAQTAQILSKPEAWTKGAMARTGPDQTDHEVRASSPAAQCFCLLGARRRALGVDNEPQNRTLRLLARAAERLFPERTRGQGLNEPVSGQKIAWFNDDPLTTHDEVIKVIELARTIRD